MLQIANIFGIMDACRRHELHQLKVNNVKDIGKTLVVTIPNTKTKSSRTFTITGKYYDICQKYIDLRPEICNTPSFFVNYQNGKCTVQNVGVNKIGNMGKEIALYLNLPNSNLYTALLSQKFCDTFSRCWWRYNNTKTPWRMEIHYCR